MTDLVAQSAVSLRQKICRVEREMLKQPQVEIPLRHFFIAGAYAREMFVPKGVWWTGKIHKFEQINILSKGDMSVVTQDGPVRVHAPFTIVSPAGSKRTGYAHEDSVWTCILSTHGVRFSEADLEQIEDIYVCGSEVEYMDYVEHQLLGVAR